MSKTGRVLQRKISFPLDAVFQSAVQDGDNSEVWRILSSQLADRKKSRDGDGSQSGESTPSGIQSRSVGDLADGDSTVAAPTAPTGDVSAATELSHPHPPPVIRVDRQTHAGLTALHQSVLNNNLDTAKMLLGHGADVDIPDINGYAPLHTAAALGFLQMSSLLVVYGADIFVKTQDGDLPVDLAKDTSIAILLQDEMISQLHQRTFMRAWLWHHFRHFLFCLCVLLLRLLREACHFLCAQWRRLRTHFTHSQELPAGNEKTKHCDKPTKSMDTDQRHRTEGEIQKRPVISVDSAMGVKHRKPNKVEICTIKADLPQTVADLPDVGDKATTKDV